LAKLKIMQTISATEAKQKFGALLDLSQREPVAIQRHDRNIVVVVSPQDYEDLRQLRIRELIEITERSSAYAEAQGMTDELLEQLLADE
jgi:prevent-host-death family protein